jgi:hypothetical protein
MDDRDLAQHEAHELPLADRLVDKAVRGWLETAFLTARAGNSYSGEEAQGFKKGLDQMQYLHLSGWQYSLVPDILDQLRRAGLLKREATDG